MAFLFKRTILPGESKPLVVDLPSYRIPSLRSALIYTWDRAKVFVQQAGTIILLISIILWALATYPKSEAPSELVTMQQQAEQLAAQGHTEQAKSLSAEAERLSAQYALSQSAAGRLGKLIEPVVKPLGFDWQIGIGIISSFAAREVIVSTLSIVYGIGAETAEENPDGLYDTLKKAKRQDGSPVFNMATCISLLVFYVLAMQCLPTQAITKRETNGWKWPLFQIAYMSILAYVAAFVAYQVARLFT
jgi:ferrous iron transport protein B